jgi:hypothetical protein
MKVAQYFRCVIGYVRDGTIDGCLRSWGRAGDQESGLLSSLTGRTCFCDIFPALKCWATFIGSLRDESSPQAPEPYIGMHARLRTIYSPF